MGKAIDEKLAELADTGHMRYHDRLRAEVPPTLIDLLAIPGLGPRTAHELHAQLGITTLEELKAAAEAGRLTERLGLGERYLVYPGRYDIRHDASTLMAALARLARIGRPDGLSATVAWPPRVLVLQATPDYYGALFHYGRVAALSGERIERGMASLQKSLQLPVPAGWAGHDAGQWRLGLLHEKKGDKAAARAAYQAALKETPGYPQAVEALKKLD